MTEPWWELWDLQSNNMIGTWPPDQEAEAWAAVDRLLAWADPETLALSDPYGKIYRGEQLFASARYVG
jgi:hypothetical protein